MTSRTAEPKGNRPQTRAEASMSQASLPSTLRVPSSLRDTKRNLDGRSSRKKCASCGKTSGMQKDQRMCCNCVRQFQILSSTQPSPRPSSAHESTTEALPAVAQGLQIKPTFSGSDLARPIKQHRGMQEAKADLKRLFELDDQRYHA